MSDFSWHAGSSEPICNGAFKPGFLPDEREAIPARWERGSALRDWARDFERNSRLEGLRQAAEMLTGKPWTSEASKMLDLVTLELDKERNR